MTTTKTYKTVNPLWKGEKWLHFTIPEHPDVTNKDSEKLGTISSSNELRFAAKWLMAVKPRGITNNYEYEGQKYKKIAYGIRKKSLIAAVEDIKNYDVDIKVSQINSVVSAIESTDDWDRDLATFLIDKEGNLRVIMLELPKMDVEKVDRSISENAGGSGNALAGSLAVKLKNIVLGVEKETVELGVIKLDKFDQVEEAVAPEPAKVVEAEAVMSLAQQELGPVLTEIMGGTASTTNIEAKKVVAPKQTVRTPAPASCIQYQIREGEFASNKCYSKSDYNDLMFYLSRYNNAIFEYNGAAGKANVTCNGFTEQFAQMCEEAKQTMKKAEGDKQLYAGNIRTVIARGR